MSQIVIVQFANLEAAFAKVDALVSAGNTANLYSVTNATLQGKIGRLWDNFKTAIHEGYLYGADAVRETIAQITAETEALIQAAGDKAREVHDHIKQRIRTFIKELIDGAIRLIPESIEVGTAHYGIVKISYEQKLSLGGSLKANFMEALELSAHGEISLGVEYGKAD